MSDVQTSSPSVTSTEQQHVTTNNTNNSNNNDSGDSDDNSNSNCNNNAYNVNLSRPPSYLLHSDSERELQHQRDLQVLQQLGEYYYRQRQRSNYFNRMLFQDIEDSNGSTNSGESKLVLKDAFKVCCLGQFKGILMAFWILAFVFLGAISVFIPSLPKAAHALWVPLLVYVIASFCVFKYNRKEAAHIDSLERYVLEARHRRRAEIYQAEQQFQLPDGHFFETQYLKEHGHPVVTLLPPPPTYSLVQTPQA